MAIQHGIMQDDLHLGNVVTMFSLSCMIMHQVISLEAIEQICKPSRQGKQKSEHTLIMLVMPPLMSVTANL